MRTAHIYIPTPEWNLKRWRVEWRYLKDEYGYCEHDNRVIVIDQTSDDETQQMTLFHEVLHASRGSEEEQVEAGETSVAHAWALAKKLYGWSDG